MAVGASGFTCFQGEDVSYQFTVSDPNVTDIAGWTIEMVVKETAAAVNPPLIAVGDITIDIDGTLTFTATFNVDLDPGAYVYSIRRTDSGTHWQLAQGSLVVVDSASID